MTLFTEKAIKHEAKLRLALDGPPGAGKTYTALKFATVLAQGGKIAFIDTERESSKHYANEFEFYPVYMGTDLTERQPYHPQKYIDLIVAAGKAGCNVLVIDSLSHAWSDDGGALDLVNSSTSSNKFAQWKDVTPLQNKLVSAILNFPGHIIVTMRTKVEYVMQEDERGKKVPVKLGMKPIQRDQIEYEFDVVGDMSHDNDVHFDKSRCPELKNVRFMKPGAEVAEILLRWLSGAPPPPKVLCADCNADITNVKYPKDPTQLLSAYTEGKFGRKLCGACATAEVKKPTS